MMKHAFRTWYRLSPFAACGLVAALALLLAKAWAGR